MITLLVVAGIVLLIAIGYMNHVVENNKLEKARLKVELTDHYCASLQRSQRDVPWPTDVARTQTPAGTRGTVPHNACCTCKKAARL